MKHMPNARANPDLKPVIDTKEPKDQHNKFYSEQSISKAVSKYQKRKGIRSYSMALREIILKGFEHPDVFGGYKTK